MPSKLEGAGAQNVSIYVILGIILAKVVVQYNVSSKAFPLKTLC
jgi:hypothetical protein